MPYSHAQIAEVCHAANRAVQRIHADDAVPVALAWGLLSEEEQAPVIAGVEHALAGADPEELHESWCAAKRAAGWIEGPVKDTEARTHPNLVPYDQLPAEQRDKDELFAAVVSALGDFPVEPLDLTGRHPGVRDLMAWLTPNPNLPGLALAVAGFHHSLAEAMVRQLPDSAELTAGLRKLLEAKDCLARAAVAAERAE